MSASGDRGFQPADEHVRQSNVARFMAEHRFEHFDDLLRRSVDEPQWFWDAVVRFLDLPFSAPYHSVVDTSRGIEWAQWFVGGRLSFTDVCLRHPADHPAIVWEDEAGASRALSYGELSAMVDACATALVEQGIGVGDGVGIYAPMVPETVAAALAVARIGAVFLPLFSGYGADAVATRLADFGAKALITADAAVRRGRRIELLTQAVEAADRVPTITTVMVIDRLGTSSDRGSHPSSAALVAFPARPSGPAAASGAGGATSEVVLGPSSFDSEHPLFVAYTSGTTGRPKGSVHVHGGWTVKVAEEGAFQCDARPGDTLFWFTDMGWIMGPWEVTAALANGATLALFDGVPDHPGPGRIWQFVERQQVTILGISPTLIRGLMAHGTAPLEGRDLASLRILASTGEPWNLEPWWWYFHQVGGGRCPVINLSGGTEVGACFLSPHPVQAIRPMSLGGPSLGMAVDVYDDKGRPVRGQVGELVCTKPWPGMTRGLYNDAERYLATYWSTYPGVWRHGDWASVDTDGQWFLHGRSDDTIKVAGKRLGPAEVESAAVAHSSVVEAAAVGVPDELKGEALWLFAVLAPGTAPTDELRSALADLVAADLGRAFRPSEVRFVRALPKTRNSKVLRRAIRATVVGDEPGDLSSLEDPSTIDAVREAS